MVELIRRIMPTDIVGGDVEKLRRMDAIVHIFYEVSGTAAAFCTALALIPGLGNNYAFIITPIFFALAAAVLTFIDNARIVSEQKLTKQGNGPLRSVLDGFRVYFMSIWTGFQIIFSQPGYVWLIPGYAFALHGHKYLENGILPQIARRYLGESAWSQIMVGGSNFGEMFGAIFVFFFADLVKTSMPWLRLDALMLLALWYIPYWYPRKYDVKEA